MVLARKHELPKFAILVRRAKGDEAHRNLARQVERHRLKNDRAGMDMWLAVVDRLYRLEASASMRNRPSRSDRKAARLTTALACPFGLWCIVLKRSYGVAPAFCCATASSRSFSNSASDFSILIRLSMAA